MKTRVITIFLILAMVFLFSSQVNFSYAQESQVEFKVSAGNAGGVGSEEHQATQFFGKRLEELSKGRIKVDTFGPEIGDTMSQMERVMEGVQEFWYGDISWPANLHGDFNMFVMAFAFNSQKHMAKFLESERWNSICDELTEKTGVKPLAWNGTRLPRVVMSKKPILSVEDFKGLKMRVPPVPIYEDVWKTIGCSTHKVAWGEIYVALTGGLIESHEGSIDGIWAIRTHEVAPNMVRTDHILSRYIMVVNNEFFNNLPEDLQEAVIQAANDAGDYANSLIDENELMNRYREEGTRIIYDEKLRGKLQQMLSDLAPILEKRGMWSEGLYDYVIDLAQ